MKVKASKGVSKQTFQRLQSAVHTLRRVGGRFQNRYAFVKSTLGKIQTRNQELESKAAENKAAREEGEFYLKMRIQRLNNENTILRQDRVLLGQLERENAILRQDRVLLGQLERENAILREDNILLQERASLDPALVLKRNEVVHNDELLEGELGFKCPISHDTVEKTVLLKCCHVIGAEALDLWWKQCPWSIGKCPKCNTPSGVVFRAT